MAFNAAFALSISTMVASFGTPITISRGGVVIQKTSGAFINSKVVVDHSLADSMLSKINNGIAECYINGLSKTPPAPGDSVVGKKRIYSVLEVETYQPAALVLAYKLLLQ